MQTQDMFTLRLQSLCVDLIVQNFERFHFAFTVSNDAKLQQNFQFLQRRFSNDLADKLLSDVRKTDIYFDFLINKHLTTVYVNWFRDSRYSMDEIFSRLPNLQTLMMADEDSVLKSVTKFCPKLSKIDASNSFITDRGIKYFCDRKNGILPCPELKKINIKKSHITKRGAKRLIRSLPSIEKFRYTNLPLVLHSIHKENSAKRRRAEFFNLTELRLTSCEYDDHGTYRDDAIYYSADVIKKILIGCPKLEKVICVLSNEEQLRALTNSRLKKLNVRFSYRKPRGNIDNFLKSSGCNLTSLRIDKCIVSFSALAGRHCPVLKELSIDDVDFIDDDNDSHFTFPRLTKIVLGMINPANTLHLLSSASPKLESVTFSNCVLSEEVKKEIITWSESTSAKNFFFTYINPVEINFFQDFLFKCHSLRLLGIFDCNFNMQSLSKTLNAVAATLPNKPKIVCVSPEML